MTHSTKNAIELKCDPEYMRTGEADARADCCYKEFHDARIAHALMKAIDKRIAAYEARRSYDGDVLTNAAINSLRQLKSEAAEILREYGVKP